MNLYAVALFLHILGAAIVFGGYGALLFVLVSVGRAKTTQEVRTITQLLRFRKLGVEYVSLIDFAVIAGGVLLSASGLSMAIGAWHMAEPWIWVSMPPVVVIGLLGAFVVSPRLHQLASSVESEDDGPLTPAVQKLIEDAAPRAIVRAAVAALVAILFVMTNKPGLIVGLSVVVVAMVLAAWSGRKTNP